MCEIVAPSIGPLTKKLLLSFLKSRVCLASVQFFIHKFHIFALFSENTHLKKKAIEAMKTKFFISMIAPFCLIIGTPQVAVVFLN